MAPKIGPTPSAPTPIAPRESAPPPAKPADAPKPSAPTPSSFDPGTFIRDTMNKLGIGPHPTVPELARNDRQLKPEPEVKDLQTQLNAWRTEHGKKGIKEDGYFGPKTEAAVKEFQKANGLPPTGRAGPGLQARVALENDAEFKGLNDDTKNALRSQLTAAGDDQAKLDNLSRLGTTKGLSDLSPAHQKQLVDALGRAADDDQLTAGLVKLADSPDFAKASDATKTSIIDTVRTSAPVTDAKVDGALALIKSPTFAALSDADKAIACEGLRAAKCDPAYAASLEKLIADPKFQAMSADEKTAVLSQAKNYPDARAVDNIKLALSKDWFTKMDLGDKQRSLKMIGRLSTHAGDRAIIDNTLKKFLSPTENFKLEWKTYTDNTHGEADDGTLWLARNIVNDGNGPMVENGKTDHLTLSTVAHEVNHNINDDKVAKTYKYFEAEYRAWYVGFKARHGREPTNAEAMSQRISWQLDESSFYGKYAKEALKDPEEAKKFYALLSKMSGKKVDASNFATVIAEDPSTWPDANKPAPVPAG
ncbi:MAG: peptidoglycan-binding protein, partial [Myxococcaceae bacterium]|nr:peptidoglycan-binding protein [Myxococcaceae bacterium]